MSDNDFDPLPHECCPCVERLQKKIKAWKMQVQSTGELSTICACRFDENDEPIAECEAHKEIRLQLAQAQAEVERLNRSTRILLDDREFERTKVRTLVAQVEREQHTWEVEQQVARRAEAEAFSSGMKLADLTVKYDDLHAQVEALRKVVIVAKMIARHQCARAYHGSCFHDLHKAIQELEALPAKE